MHWLLSVHRVVVCVGLELESGAGAGVGVDGRAVGVPGATLAEGASGADVALGKRPVVSGSDAALATGPGGVDGATFGARAGGAAAERQAHAPPTVETITAITAAAARTNTRGDDDRCPEWPTA